MAGNAHRNRNKRRPTQKHSENCLFCRLRPSQSDYKNSNGHRKNPTKKKKSRRRPTVNVQ